MSVTALICSLPVALIGTYYLVNAGSVAWMGPLEGHRNRVRVRLRRANGLVMLCMSLALYLGISRGFGRDAAEHVGLVAPLAWIATLPLLMAMLVLAWLDMRLTRKLRRDLLRTALMKNQPQSKPSNSTLDRAPRSGPASAVVLATTLLGVALSGCDDTSAQPAATPQATTRSAATRPTTMRAQDLPRAGDEEPQQLRTVRMQLGEEMFVLQVADTDEERMAGLMFRKSLAPDEGMIFIYPEQQWLSFWMKNTFIPLDIAFVDENGQVVNVAQMVPHDLEGTPSAGPAKYAIELPLNAARRAKLEAGMKLQIPAEARDAKD